MNQGRIWCVVNPTVGLPLFLGSVAITSLIVHHSVLSNTTWFSHYWNGGMKAKAASVESTSAPLASNAAGVVISVAPVANAANGETSFVITMAPKAVASVDVSTAEGLPDKVALAAPAPK